MWMNPPVTPRLQVYLFNVTNAQDYLSGQAKLKVQEIGPYTYDAPQTKNIHEWTADGKSVTFESRTIYQFVQGSALNPFKDVIIVPNLLMMTGMLKTEVRSQPDFLKRSIVWPILTSAGKKTPFVELTVAEFLWGYEDELACLDSSPPQEDDNDLFGSFEDDIFAR